MAVRLWQTGPMSRVWIFCAKCQKTSSRDVDKLHLERDPDRQVRRVTVQCHGGRTTFEIGEHMLANLDHRLNIGVFGDKLVGTVNETDRYEPPPPKPNKTIWDDWVKKGINPGFRPEKVPMVFGPTPSFDDFDDDFTYVERDFTYVEKTPKTAGPIKPAAPLQPSMPVVPPPARRRVILPEE